MPHDSKGGVLAKGDRVTMEFEVRDIQQGEDACNVTLVAINPTEKDEYLPTVACNSRLATKVESEE